jgi:uncharacterized protein YdeI (YjbR/CyaY-like superfamily)
MPPRFFSTALEFRDYLEKIYKTETELIVGFYKVGSGLPSMTWSESVDEALCFGWIDGVRRNIDKNSYQIRFTPRLKSSIWSAVNIKKIENLIEKGLMKAEGLKIYHEKKESEHNNYGYEKPEVKLSADLEAIFKANEKAWEYFQSLAPTYRKPSLNWVMSAKQEDTRLKRLNVLIADSENGTNQWKFNKYKK